MILPCLCTWAYAAGTDVTTEFEYEDDSGIYTYTLNPDGIACITGYSGETESLVTLEIPLEFDGTPVTAIGDETLSFCGEQKTLLFLCFA